MPGPGNDTDFQPAILIIGQHARARAPLLHGFLKEPVDRYKVVTAGVEPSESVAAGVLQILEQEDISASNIETGPLGRVVNENLRLVVFVSEGVKQSAPVIAAPCEDMVLSLDDPVPRIENGEPARDVFYELRDDIRERAVPAILEELGAGDPTP